MLNLCRNLQKACGVHVFAAVYMFVCLCMGVCVPVCACGRVTLSQKVPCPAGSMRTCPRCKHDVHGSLRQGGRSLPWVGGVCRGWAESAVGAFNNTRCKMQHELQKPIYSTKHRCSSIAGYRSAMRLNTRLFCRPLHKYPLNCCVR